MSIKQKLIVTFLVIAIIPILLIAVLSYSNAKKSLESTRIAGLKSIGNLKAKKLEEFFGDFKEDIAITQDYFNIKTNLPIVTKFANERTNPAYISAQKKLDNQLKTWSRIKGEIIDFMLVDPEGKIVYVINDEHKAVDLGNPLPDPDGKAFENGKKGIHFTDIFRNRVEANDLGMLVTAPVHDFNGKFIGVIALEIDMDPIFELIQDTTGLGETGETLIGRKIGNEAVFLNPLRHDPDAALNRRVTIGSNDAIPVQKAVLGEKGHSISVDYRGEEIIAHWEYIPALDWGLVAKIDTREAFASITRLRNWVTLIGAIFLSLVVIIAFYTSQSIARPIYVLHKGTEIIGSGNLDYKVGTNAKDEIGQLSKAFDRMTQSLKARTAVLNKEIEKHKQAEKALMESEKRFKDIAENAVDWIWEVDNQCKYTYSSPAVEKILGYKEDEVMGKYFYDFLHPDECEQIKKAISEVFSRKEAFLKVLNKKVHKDGQTIICETSGVPITNKEGKLLGYRGSVNDITERKKMEEELLKFEKLQSVGVLAGGIAHDFNNLLTGICGNISLARMHSKPGDKVYERLVQAEKVSFRAKDLTQQLLTFSRGGAPVKNTSYIRWLIKDTTDFALRGSNATYEPTLADDLWPVEVDKGQINQVINNLIINAKQAMPEGGIINVGAENITISEGETSGKEFLKEGRYVKITIKDHGKGISKEHLQKIFDPYFTTKESGSGLGLATSYKITKNHDGLITVKSKLGVGTTFHIYLPASEKEVFEDEEKMTTVDLESKGKKLGKVLVMDDEEHIRELVGEILKPMGYEVANAIEGREAIELYKKARESNEPFDLVIMDLTIPGGMGGKKAIKEVLKIDPEAKVIVSSGYANDPIMTDYRKHGFSDVVTKPFKIAELSETVNRLIKGMNE